MSDKPSILESGKKFAKEEAKRTTTLGFEAEKAEGGTPSATVTVGTAGSNSWFDWGVAGWVKRQFKRGGTSAGVKGEVRFGK